MHRPGRDDLEAGLDERRGQRVPGLHLLVREHHREDAVRSQDTEAFAEDVLHLPCVVTVGHLLLAATQGREAGRVGYRLGVLVGQRPREPVRVEVTDRPLEPDVEEVGELRVLDIVVVGRVDADEMHTAIR